MRRGERSGTTHAREELQEHRRIKPRANERPVLTNDALGRLQIPPSDPVWDIDPERWKFITITPGQILPGALRVARCWYCAQSVNTGEVFLYSKALCMLAHVECHGNGRNTVDST